MGNRWIWVCLAAALAGWLVNMLIIWLALIRLKRQLAKELEGLGRSFLQSAGLKERIMAPDNVQLIMPQIDDHVDVFLRTTLPARMPVIGMFVGDKTMAELKTVFLAELETLFPVIMGSFADLLQKEQGLQRLMSGPAEQLKTTLYRHIRKKWWVPALAGAITGLVAALVALAMQ